MREPIKGLYPGCKIKPVRTGGNEGWYPYITFVGQHSPTKATVILSTGEIRDSFNPLGFMEFVVVDECLENK